VAGAVVAHLDAEAGVVGERAVVRARVDEERTLGEPAGAERHHDLGGIGGQSGRGPGERLEHRRVVAAVLIDQQRGQGRRQQEAGGQHRGGRARAA